MSESNVTDRIDIVADKIGNVARECEARHHRCNGEIAEANMRITRLQDVVIRNRETLIVATGLDGRNGKVSETAKHVETLAKKVEAMERLVVKHSAIAGVVAAIAAVVFSALVNKFL